MKKARKSWEKARGCCAFGVSCSTVSVIDKNLRANSVSICDVFCSDRWCTQKDCRWSQQAEAWEKLGKAKSSEKLEKARRQKEIPQRIAANPGRHPSQPTKLEKTETLLPKNDCERFDDRPTTRKKKLQKATKSKRTLAHSLHPLPPPSQPLLPPPTTVSSSCALLLFTAVLRCPYHFASLHASVALHRAVTKAVGRSLTPASRCISGGHCGWGVAD